MGSHLYDVIFTNLIYKFVFSYIIMKNFTSNILFKNYFLCNNGNTVKLAKLSFLLSYFSSKKIILYYRYVMKN